jgi:glycosyltransferase involved in cell wall biosynthesis
MIFTIAIPTFNNSDIIGIALDSCLNQEYELEYEVLVVDNCSNDGTDKILDSYEDKISRVRNDKTVTQFENHNICIENAKGDYIVFCHSDDELLPDALTKFLNIIKRKSFPLKFVCWGRSMYRDFYVNYSNGGYSLNQIASGIDAISIFQIGGIAASGACYSVESFKNIGGFIKTNHKMAPSDLVTMWLLCLNLFEFEMSDRIFFKREFASTADFTERKQVYDSILDAVDSFTNVVDRKKVQLVVNEILKFNLLINPNLIKVLIELNLVSKNSVRIRMIKHLIKNPQLFLIKKYFKLIF